MRISEKLIGPLLGRHSNDLGWKAWLAHVKYFNTMMAPNFTLAQIQRLELRAQIQ